MPEINIKVNTVYDGSAAKEAIRDEEKLNEQARENQLTRRFQREGGLDETTARQKARLVIEGHAANTAARQQAAEQKRFAEEYTRDWQKAINEEVAQKKAAAAVSQKQSSEAAAAEKARSEEAWKRTQQTRGLADYDRDLQVGELRAQGKRKEAEAAEKKLFIEQHSLELQKKYGVSQEEALKRAERMHAVMQSAEGHGHGGAMGTARMVGEGLDMATGGYGWVMRAMSVARGAAMVGEAGPVGGVAALLAAPLIGYAIYRGMRKGVSDDRLALSNKLREEGIGDTLKMDRLHRYGGPDQAAEMALQLEEERKQIQGRYVTVADEGHRGILGGLIRRFYDKNGWDIAQRGIPGIPVFRTQTQKETEELEGEEKRNQENLANAEKERRYWNDRVTKPSIEASEQRGEGNTAEARKIEKEMSLATERKRLEKLMPHDPDSVERGVAAKRKEIEDGGYNDFMKHGGYSEVRATELRTQGKMREARALEYDAMWWSKYNSIIGKVGDEHADVAIEAANADVLAQKKADAGNFGRAIDARAGAGEAMRVATMAAKYVGINVNDGTTAAVKDLHNMVRSESQKSRDEAFRETFKPRPFR